jgi:hypothetical protein
MMSHRRIESVLDSLQERDETVHELTIFRSRRALGIDE